MQSGTIISVDIALITIIITTIGLSISGYIFLNNYFGMIIEMDGSMRDIVEDLNKTYIMKIILACIFSAVFIGCCFWSIFMVKDQSGMVGSAIVTFRQYIVQHLSYFGSIGIILYNFHFLCHIINPLKLIQKRANRVAKKQIAVIKESYSSLQNEYRTEGHKTLDERYVWKGHDEIGVPANIENTLTLIKYIHEIEAIITKVIELNAIKGQNRNKEEALKFIFATSSIGSMKYERRLRALCGGKNLQEQEKQVLLEQYRTRYDVSREKRKYDNDQLNNAIERYVAEMKLLIDRYVEYYEQFVILRNALVKMEKAFSREISINENENLEVLQFAALMLRIMLERFVNFVKITNLNIGGGYFQHACFNCSDLSNSNLTGGDFSYAQFNNTILKNSDLSNSEFSYASFNDADLREVNLGYANLCGTDFDSANFTKAKLTDITFHTKEEIKEHLEIRENAERCLKDEQYDRDKLQRILKNIRESKYYTTMKSATLDGVMLKSIDMSGISMSGASFINSVLTNSLWINVEEADGMKMSGANLRKSFAIKSNFSSSDFGNANIGQMIFIDVTAVYSYFGNANAVGTKVVGSNSRIIIEDEDTEKKKELTSIEFADKDFNLDKVKDKNDLYSNWMQINFNSINAVESEWYNTILNESDFQEAILKNSVFSNIAANWVNAVECDFTYVRLTKVSFRMAKMDDAIFTRAHIEEVWFDDANIRGGIFLHALIAHSSFNKSNLDEANFAHTMIIECSFIDCTLNNAYFRNTTFKNTTFEMSVFIELFKHRSSDVQFIDCYIDMEFDQEETLMSECKGLDQNHITRVNAHAGEKVMINI